MAQFTIPGAAPATVDEHDNERQFLALGDCLLSYGSPPLIYGDGGGMYYRVRANQLALVRGSIWGSGPDELTIAVSANAGPGSRVDRSVLRLDRATWEITVETIQGTPGSSSLAALSRDTGATGEWEWEIGRISVGEGVSAISAGAVTPRLMYLGAPLMVADTDHATPGNSPAVWLRYIPSEAKLALHTSADQGQTILTEDTGWLNLSAATGWSVNTSLGARYRRLNRVVTVTAALFRTGTPISPSVNTIMATLPAGFRPAVEQAWQGYLDGGHLVHGRVHTNGNVLATTYATSSIGTNATVQIATLSFPV